jgi:dTDP-4-amino-4,6-dideoxygalactose transaminase
MDTDPATNAAILNETLRPLETLRLTVPPKEVGHAYYKYYAFVRPERLKDGWSRDRVVTEIAERGVPCFTGSCSEIYLEKAFSAEMRPAERVETARELGETSMMLLVHPTLSEEDMQYVGETTVEVITSATR